MDVALQEISTVTSKGQITIPRVVRQYLGIASGHHVAFTIGQGTVTVSRVDPETEHSDPAICSFLSILERDIKNGQNVQFASEETNALLQKYAEDTVDYEEDIVGEVSL